MWREEFGLVEMLLTYIGDFVKFESYADWRPVLVDILSSHEEVRRRRLAVAIEYSSGERMKDDMDEDFFYETKQPYIESGDDSLLTPIEERSNTSTQSLIEYSHSVKCEDDKFIESNRMPSRTSECVNDTINVQDDVVGKEETDAQRSESQISEESIVCLEMETRGDTSELGNVTGASYLDNVNTISEGNERETQHELINETFKCLVCGKSFVAKTTLINHLKRHYELGSYRCDMCDKSFYSNADLKRHLRIHSGERPFKCNLCGKVFALKANMKSHVKRMHFDERPFSCQLCGRAFYSKSHLKSHMKTWHKS